MSSSPNSSSSDVALTAASLVPLHEVVCRVEVMLGAASMSARRCLELRPDSIIRLGAPAGHVMQVVINGVAVAHGEVVIVDDSTAIRITEIISAATNEGEE